MKFSKYGITASLLKEEDLELVRQWRNDPEVVRNYQFREYITAEMQNKWFRSVNNINNLYTIIEYRGEKIGVINMKNINWENHTGEGGIFIPDPRYRQTSVTAILSYISTELPFKFFNWKVEYASVMKGNTAGQAFVKSFGYRLCPGQEKEENQRYFCTKESFERNSEKIKIAIELLVGVDDPFIIMIEYSEFGDDLVLQWERQFLSFIKPDRSETTEAGRIYYFT